MSFLKQNIRLKICGTVIVLFVLSLSLLFAQGAVPTGSWGLSFQKKGLAPLGNASRLALAQYDAAFVGDESQQIIYLTFDAGYESGQTPQILDVLKAHEVPAAFFLVGNYLETQPGLVCRMVQEGHIVGNHTYHHNDMSKIGDLQVFSRELQETQDKYKEITGLEMQKFYRPPQGLYSEENLKMAQELGYKTVFWSLAYVDWYKDKQPTAQEAFDKLIPRIHNGAVVLLHSTSQTNADILDQLLTKWKAMGYQFGTLEQLFSS